MNGLDLFSGIGGLSVALAPWVTPVAYCENDPYARLVLLARMADGSLPVAPIWHDVRTLRASALPSRIDAIYAGFPCQDISDASHGRGGGIDGEQSGLWRDVCRLISDITPSVVFIENVGGAAAKKWVPPMRRALRRLGYASVSASLCAAEVGAPFKGERVFLAASNCQGESARALHAQMASMSTAARPCRTDWRQPPPGALGVADGVPARMERLHALGNAVVPAQAREAFMRLMGLKEAA